MSFMRSILRSLYNDFLNVRECDSIGSSISPQRKTMNKYKNHQAKDSRITQLFYFERDFHSKMTNRIRIGTVLNVMVNN